MKSTVERATSVLLMFLFSGLAVSVDMIRVKQVGSHLAPRKVGAEHGEHGEHGVRAHGTLDGAC